MPGGWRERGQELKAGGGVKKGGESGAQGAGGQGCRAGACWSLTAKAEAPLSDLRQS